MKNPKAVFIIISTGNIVYVGAKNEDLARKAILKLDKELKSQGIMIINFLNENKVTKEFTKNSIEISIHGESQVFQYQLVDSGIVLMKWT